MPHSHKLDIFKSVGWPAGRPAMGLTGRPTDRLIDPPADRPTGRPTNRPTGRLAERPADRPTDRPVGGRSCAGWWVGRLVGWLVGWSVGWWSPLCPASYICHNEEQCCPLISYIGLLGMWCVLASGAEITPEQKVIELMQGMLVKGKNEKHDEQVQFAAYKQFCDNTSVEKKRAIAKAEETIEILTADIAKYT